MKAKEQLASVSNVQNVEFMASINGIKRKALIHNAECACDFRGTVKQAKWNMITYTVGNDPDFLFDADELRANNYVIFQALTKAVRKQGSFRDFVLI